ncbi:Intracisternal A-particle Pol-related polyprotein [Dictyocoela muelleri]|nr:Intracisternal A-particle Pol-related polyprotein [Dictyocoela muelleri]
MYQTLNRYIKIKDLRKLCHKVTSNCLECIQEKKFKKQMIYPDYDLKLKNINDIVSLDIKCPIPTKHFNIETTEKSFYILLMTDLFSRFSIVSILFDINSLNVTKEFEKRWISKFKAPKYCLTDNGRQFTIENFNNMLRTHKIYHIYTSPYNPKGNSIVKRLNREVSTALRMSRNLKLPEIMKNIL